MAKCSVLKSPDELGDWHATQRPKLLHPKLFILFVKALRLFSFEPELKLGKRVIDKLAFPNSSFLKSFGFSLLSWARSQESSNRNVKSSLISGYNFPGQFWYSPGPNKYFSFITLRISTES